MKLHDILSLIKSYVVEATGENIEDIDENASFFRLGISSVQALKIVNKLRKKLEVDISPVAMFEYKCISELAGYLYDCSQESA